MSTIMTVKEVADSELTARKNAMIYYSDYDSKPIGRSNPYYCCASCGLSDPQINGTLSNHYEWCEYRLRLEALGCTDSHDPRGASEPILDSQLLDNPDSPLSSSKSGLRSR
jgi:hypothetical protein